MTTGMIPQQPNMLPGVIPFEASLGRGMYSGAIERTFIDKVLSRQDVEEINEIMGKVAPTKEELNRLVALICGIEIKLLNFDRNDQYINGKFVIWIEEMHKIVEDTYDYHESKYNVVDEYERKQLDDIRKMNIQGLKSLCSIMHFMTRSTLSTKGAAFDKFTSTRSEVEYTNVNTPGTPELQAKKRFWII